MKEWLFGCNQNKRNSCSLYHSLNVFFKLLLTISLQLVASYNRCLPSLLPMPTIFTSFVRITFAVLWSYRNHVKKISGSWLVINKGSVKKRKTSINRKSVFEIALKGGREWKFCMEELQLFTAFVMLKATFSKHWLVKLAWHVCT